MKDSRKTSHKTNAARILDQLGIPYELREYPVDENDLSASQIQEVGNARLPYSVGYSGCVSPEV